MSSFRVYEIAGQLNISSEEVIKMGKELGLDLKSHSSVLSQPQVEEIASVYNKLKAESQTGESTAINNTTNEIGRSGGHRNIDQSSAGISGKQSQNNDAPKTMNQFKPIPKRGIISSSVQWKPVPKRGETVKEALDKVILLEEELKLSPEAPVPAIAKLREKVLKTALAKLKTVKEKVPKVKTVEEKAPKEKAPKVKTVEEKAPGDRVPDEKIIKKQEVSKNETQLKDSDGKKSTGDKPQADLRTGSEQLIKDALRKSGSEQLLQPESERPADDLDAGEIKGIQKQKEKTWEAAGQGAGKTEIKKAGDADKPDTGKREAAIEARDRKEVTLKEPRVEGKPQVSARPRYQWDEEKKFNIKQVLDRVLDREEKEGRIKPSSKVSPSKKALSKKDQFHDSLHVSEDGSELTALKEKTVSRTEIKKNIEFPEGISVKQLSERINVASGEILQSLFNMGDMVTINQPLDKDTIEILSQEYNFKYSIIGFEESIDEEFNDSEESLVIRPPIVTVMGHVDHGKTTLLDAIRKENVVSSEAGGITQKIGAYQTVFNNRKITFIDTPGHEAFTTMRARGARVTDIAVIVIAADDGIMPQTVEAINHAKQAHVPIIVAVNKTDLPNANQEKVKQGLTEYDLVPEEWGGDTIFVSISAKNNTNIEGLLEMILLVADMNEIKGNPSAEGIGIIIESKLDKNFGPIGTVLVKRGSIKVGDFFITGNSYGRVRNIKNEYGKNITKAELSQPIEISGFTTVPQAGDKFFIVKNEKVAKDQTSKRENIKKQIRLSEVKKHVTLEDLADLSKENEVKRLKIILKSESNGSLDAVEKSLWDAGLETVIIDIIHKGVGAITDSDILLASASDAIVIGFGVIANAKAKVLAKEEKIEIRTYDIIYKLIEDIKLAFRGMLEPKYEEKIKGNIEIREIFKVTKMGNVAGCYVLDGEAERGDSVRIIRDGSVIYTSKIDTLHRFKDDVKKVSAGYECGIRIENYQDVSKGDLFEVFEQKEVKQ
jgi:translation initiation factor IF-2